MVRYRDIPVHLDSGQSISSDADHHFWKSIHENSETLNPPLPVTLQPRDTEWCWAVVVTSMHNHLDDDDVATCSLVETVRPGSNCCADPTSDICRQPDEVAVHLAKIGNAKGDPIASGVSWSKVQQEISANRPIGAVVS